jgi:hypothetical protein
MLAQLGWRLAGVANRPMVNMDTYLDPSARRRAALGRRRLELAALPNP